MKTEVTTHSGRAYTWFLMTYASYEEFSRLWEIASHYAWGYHDKDTTLDDHGKEVLKTPHTHILITFQEWISLDKIKSIIDSDQNTMGECRRKVGNTFVKLNIQGCFDYILHLNDSDKYPYDASIRHTDGTEYWTRYDKTITQDNSNELFLQDLLGAYRTDSEYKMFMANKYGKDYIKNRDKYDTFRFEHITNEIYLSQHERYDPLINYLLQEDIDCYTATVYIKERLNFERGFYIKQN